MTQAPPEPKPAFSFLARRQNKKSRLPERIAQKVAAQENGAEVLIKYIQLAIVLFLALLYAISPKLGTAETRFITPTILATYITLTIIGLIWSKRYPLPDWAVYISVIFDMVLLYALIWSIHIQYEQPPSFYLKAPTMLYVFIFIALRALRFQPRFVMASGITAALGWVAMFAYVLHVDTYEMMVTRNYVTYLTSNSILVGAEIDKIISILVVTAVIALALHKARDLLVMAVRENEAANSLSRFFDEDVASNIRDAETRVNVGEGVTRDAAILNIDLRGFSRLAQTLEPDRAIQLLTLYQKRVLPLIQREGGSIDKFLGDGILASFGAVNPMDDACAAAMRSVEAILKDTMTWIDDPDLKILSDRGIGLALAHGPVVFGAVGDDKRLELTVIGSTVNFSAKLEKHNKVLSSLAVIDAQAYRQAESEGFTPTLDFTMQTSAIDGIEGQAEIYAYAY